VSFKTNVNRAKTKKWVTAKKNAYDGDDWGDYDEYDEYGAAQEPPQAEPAPSQRYYAGGPPQRTYTDRSFTDPAQQGPPGKARRNSFEAGEEHRAFSASMPPPQEQDYGQQPARPPPLQTQVSPMPADIHSSPSRSQFPPRKSSISQVESPIATSPRPRTGSHSDKPLPFVRPADIYKRMEEERVRERASLDSSRPSLDSLSSRPKDDPQSPTSDGGRVLQPLETVAERKSEYLPDFGSAFAQNGKQPSASGLQSQAPASQAPVVSPPNDQGFRSFVDQAFVRTDDQRSIPPTPISKDSDSNMSRTNTGSTAGISPIMSRVPSAATSAVKRSQAGVDGSTPAIAEEPSDAATPVPQPTSYFIHDTPGAAAQRLPADHSRNLSSSSLRSGLATPTPGESPARSPVIAPQKDLPEPKAADIATESPDQSHNMDGGLSGPSSAYAAREVDIANAAKSSPTNETSGLGAAEKQSQDAFLESHVAQSPIDDVLPRSRSESPSKGRVQALASTFGDVSHSRRGSTQSNMSRNSIQSWEKSQNNSRAPSPTKGSPSKPSSPVKEFRPHLPGQWESYATTAATPLDQGERDRSLGYDTDKTSGNLGATDLTPTTAKRPVEEVPHDGTSDPLAALKSAGAAMAQSFRTTVGMDDASSEPRSQHAEPPKGPPHGDMYMPRPLQLERTISSISSIPPTPPAKDTPKDEHPPQLHSEDVDTNTPTQQKRPDFFAQLSTQPSVDDQESDRLRKEIVASLEPIGSTDPKRTSLQPASPGANRASSILPAEYDSYWADGGAHAAAGQSPDVEHSVPALSSTAVVPSASQTNEPPKPFISRFSWENNTPQLAPFGSVVGSTAVPEPAKTSHEDTIPSPAVERAADEEHRLLDTQTGAGHTLTVTEPDPITEPDLPPQSSTLAVDHDSLASPTREYNRSPGLHVVNSAINPEAVDLPPRLNADVSAPTRNSEDDLKPLQQELDREVVNPAISTSIPVPGPSSPTQAHHPEPTPTSPTSGKPLDIREIATISSAAERIATYNHTREHWATHDHGLEGWLVSALDTNPTLATQIASPQRATTGTVRHKHTASLSILGKFGSSSMQVNEQQQAIAAQAPVGSESPTSGAPSGSNAAFDRRVASRQLEAKGKDLLHTANVLSGKGLTSAKGLFAKGKSRFGREKVEK
jgi:hypothetical protein